jgi:hypothetical protein
VENNEGYKCGTKENNRIIWNVEKSPTDHNGDEY